MEFSKLHIDKKLLDGIELMGFKETTPIQEKCIPEIKAGKDVVGQSLTGSGKTAAFGLPILEKIVPGAGIQALILTPTRELCAQVRDNMETMGKFLPINVVSIFGGVGFYQQIEDIKIAEIVVATPGRLLDHINRGNIKFNAIKYVVLDEADKMFEMGFEEDVDKILRRTPKERQTVMFSATMPRAAQNIIQKYLKSPIFVKEQLHVDRSLLTQVYYDIRREAKFSLLVHLLKQKTPGPAIVFCGTKREVDRVAHNLKKLGLFVMPVHGDLAQTKRQHAVTSFKAAKIDVLVATDVAARGLDIKDVTHVYNYDVPRTAEEYTHRIGRTARAGKKGDAVTLLSARDYDNFQKILRYSKMDIKQEHVPDFEMIETKKHDFGTNRFGSRDGGESYPAQRSRFGRERSFGSRGRDRDFGGHGRGKDRNDSFAPRREGSDYGSSSNFPRHSDRRRNDYQNAGQGSRRFDSAPRHFEKSHLAKPGQKDEWHFNKSVDKGTSPRTFGKEKHESHAKPIEHAWVAENKTKTTEPEIQGGYERTPRTHEPLFPTSHYHPEHQKNKAALKRTERVKGFDKFGRKHKSHEERRFKKQTGTDMEGANVMITPEAKPSFEDRPRYPARSGHSRDGPKRDFAPRRTDGERRGFDRGPRRTGSDNRRSFDRGAQGSHSGPKRDFKPRRDSGARGDFAPRKDFGNKREYGHKSDSDRDDESFSMPRHTSRPHKAKYMKNNYGRRKRF